jgi:phosphorylase kinase alpha/beta subunit
MDQQRFYIASDYELMIDNLKNELNFLKSSWQNVLGRPLVVLTFKHIHLGLNYDFCASDHALWVVV